MFQWFCLGFASNYILILKPGHSIGIKLPLKTLLVTVELIIRVAGSACCFQTAGSLTYMSEKTAADREWTVSTRLQVLQEVLRVKVPQLLHVSKNDAALPSQVLGQVQPLHLWEILLDDVAEGADVLPLRGNHLVHDVLHFAAAQNTPVLLVSIYF